jgi:hypothetical protein
VSLQPDRIITRTVVKLVIVEPPTNEHPL